MDACLATSADPLIYPAIEIGRSVYVDGGITSNFPIDEFQATHAIGFTRSHGRRANKGIFDQIKNTIGTVIAHNEIEDRADCQITLLKPVRDGLDFSTVSGLAQDFLTGLSGS